MTDTGLEDTDPLHALRDVLQDYPEEYPDGWWLDAARCRWWLSLHVDWKAYDEVAWQVQAIARTLKLNTDFLSPAAVAWDDYFGYQDRLRGDHTSAAHSSTPGASLIAKLGKVWRARRGAAGGDRPDPARQPPSDTPTLDVLGEASGWLRAQGYELLYLDTGGDEHLALPVRLDLLAPAQITCKHLKLATYLL